MQEENCRSFDQLQYVGTVNLKTTLYLVNSVCAEASAIER